MTSGKLLELHLAEEDRFEGRPLYEAIVAKCRELSLSGVTVFRGLEGYGPTAEIRRQPIGILIVDNADAIEKAMPVLETMMGKRLMAVSDIMLKRVTTG